jgi:uncharacterized protein
MKKDRSLILFVKYPQKGKVKSRLARELGEDFATDLYANFIFDTLRNIKEGDYNLRISFHPPEREREIKRLCGNNYDYCAQCGIDLGERMKNAFAGCFAEGFKSAILVGSDCPDLPPAVIGNAFAMLEDKSDAVIGPAADGGYYLIGFRNNSFLPEIFCGISWGSRSVLKDTIDILRSHSLATDFVQKWPDVDTSEDLMDLINRSEMTGFSDSQTMIFLRSRRVAKG